ncbi:uncharacterized protein SRS1_11777 [Sporisorium reilianum f. sp. reilianum]|uniref:Ubiquitin-like protease family profile domain-containing protein n=1 Tax=Sporisorium reilianum f. sp. reilianum TaxID=72559 RepID=A0A2N8U719_9BASI|nr:uncharacterized protein SRS1_11777 [Sporisorium reilianum f. sp. reilianum]
MAPKLSADEYNAVKAFHGIPRRKATLTDVPRNGATPENRFSSSSSSAPSKRTRSKLPRGQPLFVDNLHSDVERPYTSEGSARRTGFRSASQRTPSPNSQARPPAATTSNTVYVDVPASSKPDKGKAKAQDLSPRATRSKTLRRASAQSEPINLASDDDDDDDLQVVPQPFSSSRASKHPSKAQATSAALQAKENRRGNEAESSFRFSAAIPDSFYSRHEPFIALPANRPSPHFNHRRPNGPIQLEEPKPRRASRSEAIVHVADSPEPEPDVEFVSPHRLDRGLSSSQSRPRMVDRMKPKGRSPTHPDRAPPRSSSAAANNVSPLRSLSRSPQSRSKPELSPPPQDHDDNGFSRSRKRMRTEAGASASQEKQPRDEPLKFPFEVRLRAIVVSDAWRSRDHDHITMLLQQNALFFGMATGDPQMARIRYSDVRQIMASKPDVKSCGILCLTLTPNSESAHKVAHVFPDYDARASSDAAEIQLIARDVSETDLHNHNLAIASITHKLLASRSDSVKVLWLNEHGTRSKISSVESVRRAHWPDSSTTSAQPLSSTPVPPRPKRTLIVPGANREPVIETRDFARQFTTYTSSLPRKKTFNIQPDSPNASADVSVDVDMPDAFSKSKSPALAPLTMPKAKATPTPPPPKVEVRRPRVASDGTILHYPYEGTGAMSLRESDFDKLLDGALLNDVVIEFGMKFILEEIRARDPGLAESIHVFNTFFFPILMSDSVETSYAKLRRWTAREDLFSKKYIVIPVNENYHWYLALIVNPGYILTDHGKDTSSEQDKEEVAQALTLPAEDSSQGIAASESKEAAPEPRQDRAATVNSEPETPPLPPLHLPLPSLGNNSASHSIPMDVDSDSRPGTPNKPTASATDPDQLIIITLDSLGQRHVKLSNKLFEYLWREAWDKKKSTVSKQPKEPVDDKDKQAKPHDGDVLPTAPSAETAHAQAAAADKDAPKDQAKETPKDATDDSTDEDAVQLGVRAVKVQDTRRSTAYAATKPAEAEAWAKSLPKAVYISAQVPEQPNFCDCGIYLLHYIHRFFSKPDEMLKLTVEAKDRLSSVNKAGPSLRQHVKRDIEESVKAVWQAGEVKSKRAYWRSKLVELAEGWQAYKKQQKEASAAKSEHDETRPSKDDKEPVVGSSQQQQQQKQAPSPSPSNDANIAMPDAVPGISTEEASNAEQATNPSEEDAVDSLGMTRVSLDDIERSVDDCVNGKDPAASLVVDNILAQAMATQHGPLSQEQLQQLQMEDREQAEQRRLASEWRFNFRDMGAPSSAVPSEGDPGSPALSAAGVKALTEPRKLEQQEPLEPVRASPTVSSRSVSPDPVEHGHKQRQQQHQTRTTPSAFGADIIATASGTSEPQASLSFSSSKKFGLDEVRDAEDASINGDGRPPSSETALDSSDSSSSFSDSTLES